jgi:hypothetical protein
MKRKTHAGPKRRIWHRLGPFFVNAALPVAYFVITTYINHKILVSIKKTRRSEKKNSHRAQTTPNASFGPVFVNAAPCQSLCPHHLPSPVAVVTVVVVAVVDVAIVLVVVVAVEEPLILDM